jgi:glucan phosphoethanolaminetransferase (alkaline phosphatase superfamily)
VHYVDQSLEAVIAELDRHGINTSNTVYAFYSDHGESFGARNRLQHGSGMCVGFLLRQNVRKYMELE